MMAEQKLNGSAKARIFLVDDDPPVRWGVRALLEMDGSLAVCGEAEGIAGAARKIRALQPNLVVVDLSLRDGDGIDLISQLRWECPALKFLVFSMHDELAYVQRAFRAGAHGYLTKDEGTEKMIEAVQQVLAGKRFLSESMTDLIGGSLPGLSLGF